MTEYSVLDKILEGYRDSFSSKVYSAENDESDILMQVFGISPELKRENRQYWGRELGKCWELLVNEICKNHPSYSPAIKIGQDEPCDLVVGEYAIDTKYRIGSGDSGTLKKFKSYGSSLRNGGYQPVFLILREDNLPAAINACKVGTWKVMTGQKSLEFVEEISGFNVENYLKSRKEAFLVTRQS